MLVASGVTDRLLEIGDIVDMLEAAATKPNRPATYKKHGQISTEPLPAVSIVGLPKESLYDGVGETNDSNCGSAHNGGENHI